LFIHPSLDDAVFETMEGDDRDAPAGSKDCPPVDKRILEHAELVGRSAGLLLLLMKK
jgi:hypothetical protein